MGSGLVAGVVLQTYFGTSDDWFEYKFLTTKHPDDLYEFFQAEELIKFFSLAVLGLPTMDFIMAGTTFRTDALDGFEATTDVDRLAGALHMDVSFLLTEEEEEDEEGNTVVGYFNRREKFTNYFPFTGLLIWDSTWNFGYKRLSDGRAECFITGERFYGPFPARIIMMLHWMVVGNLVEKHVESADFGGDPELAEDKLANIPKHVLKQYLRSLRGEVEKAKASHTGSIDRLAAYNATIAELKALEEKQLQAQMAKSTTLRRRPSMDEGGADEEVKQRQTAQLQIADKAARKTLQAAITQITEGDQGAAVAESIRTLAANPELQYKEIKKRPSRRPSRKQSKA